MSDYQPKRELSETEITIIAQSYLNQHLAAASIQDRKSFRGGIKKLSGAGPAEGTITRDEAIRRAYKGLEKKCHNNDSLILAAGVKAVELYKALNKKEEGELGTEQLDRDFARPNHNFIGHFPSGMHRKNWLPGGNFFKIWRGNDLGFVGGKQFFPHMMRRRIWHDMEALGKEQGIDVEEIGKKSGGKLTAITYVDPELLKLGLRKMFDHLRGLGYKAEDLHK